MLVCYFVPPPSFLARHNFRGIPSSSPTVSYLSNSAAAAANFFFAPYTYRPDCYHHLQDTLVPGLRKDRSQRSRIGHVAIYCTTVFCLFVLYFPIPYKPASTIDSYNDGYSKIPPPSLLGCLPVRCCATL